MEPIKFQYITSDETWDVTTPDGYVYKFKVSESFVDYSTTPGYDQKSAWYLTEIVSPTNEKVQFFYTVLSDQYIKPTGVFYDRKSRTNHFGWFLQLSIKKRCRLSCHTAWKGLYKCYPGLSSMEPGLVKIQCSFGSEGSTDRCKDCVN